MRLTKKDTEFLDNLLFLMTRDSLPEADINAMRATMLKYLPPFYNLSFVDGGKTVGEMYGDYILQFGLDCVPLPMPQKRGEVVQFPEKTAES